MSQFGVLLKGANYAPKGLYYKTFYGRNLRIFTISSSVCPWQAFPTYSNVCG